MQNLKHCLDSIVEVQKNGLDSCMPKKKKLFWSLIQSYKQKKLACFKQMNWFNTPMSKHQTLKSVISHSLNASLVPKKCV